MSLNSTYTRYIFKNNGQVLLFYLVFFIFIMLDREPVAMVTEPRHMCDRDIFPLLGR